MAQFDACIFIWNITVNTIINMNSSPSRSTNIYDVLIYFLITSCACICTCVLAYLYAYNIVNVSSQNSRKLSANKQKRGQDHKIETLSPVLDTKKVENSGEETMPHTTDDTDKQNNVNANDFTTECQSTSDAEAKDEDDGTDTLESTIRANLTLECQTDAENATKDEDDNPSSDKAMAVPNRPPELAVLLEQLTKSGIACSEIEMRSEKHAIIRTTPSAPGPDKTVLSHAAVAVDGQPCIKFKDELTPYFNVITDNMGVHWPQLATNLGLKFTQIQAIKQQNNNDCWMCCQQILDIWRSNNGKEATKQDLIHAIKETKQQDVAEMLEAMQLH